MSKNPFARNTTEDHLVTIFYNILCALNFLHNLGLMHRDLKPENILINDDCSIKLCDFSFTRTLHSCHRQEDETMSNSSAGFLSVSSSSSTQSCSKRSLSPHVQARFYRAPEIIMTQKCYTQKIDVWSLGCIFAEIAANQITSDQSSSNSLFQGSSCFPLSPRAVNLSVGEDKRQSISKNDQLVKILKTIPTVKKSDLEWFSSEA